MNPKHNLPPAASVLRPSPAQGFTAGSVAASLTMRIKRNHYYVLADHPGISGFKDYTRKVECVVTGHKAANNRSIVAREYLASGLGKFRVNDGHLPDYQPIMSEVDALRWLDENPFQEIVKI